MLICMCESVVFFDIFCVFVGWLNRASESSDSIRWIRCAEILGMWSPEAM